MVWRGAARLWAFAAIKSQRHDGPGRTPDTRRVSAPAARPGIKKLVRPWTGGSLARETSFLFARHGCGSGRVVRPARDTGARAFRNLRPGTTIRAGGVWAGFLSMEDHPARCARAA